MRAPGLERIQSLVFAVRSVEQALELWRGVLGVDAELREQADAQVREAVFFVGDVQVRLCESTAPTGAHAQWIAARGEGLCQLGLQVHARHDVVQACRAAGLDVHESSGAPHPVLPAAVVPLQLLDAPPRPSARPVRSGTRKSPRTEPRVRERGPGRIRSTDGAPVKAIKPLRTVRPRGKVRKGGKK